MIVTHANGLRGVALADSARSRFPPAFTGDTKSSARRLPRI